MKNIKFILVFFIFLPISCGLDNIIYLEPPINAISNTIADPKLGFTTTDVSNTANAPGYFKGYDVYYLIYKSEATAKTEDSNIRSYNKTNSYGVATWLKESKKYQLLNQSPFIEQGTVNRQIIIRWNAGKGLYIDGISTTSNIFRLNDPSKTFEVSQIKDDDRDVYKDSSTSSSTPTEFYVNFYAVTIGIDENYSPIYSELLPLGTAIKIE